ncbi:hypothetical protein [Moritella sp. F3]|uniref:hypothetical protein n=1 Tax=Moritella sp. F3 TaxID=2718882 RepID=UPI0018E11243|nr:hypothetical protein [Moritella sp. F3]GIC77634.1 hypothetical protein FMO001_23610 [Moritella sp. F1]GIC82047.1 hypothetical protein FMO003_23280 [Moritella sp. F3]
MDLRTLNAYTLYGVYTDTDTLERMSESIQFPKAVYDLEMSEHGVIADNTDETWNGSARPFFAQGQLDSLAVMLNQIDEVEAKVEDFKITIYNDASGEHEVISSCEGKYELSGWSLFKFDKADIWNRIQFYNWEISDVANLIIWLEANDAGDYESYNDREFSQESDELRRLAYMAIKSIRHTFNVVTLHGLIEKHEILKSLVDDFKN